MPLIAMTREMGSLGKEVAKGVGEALGIPVLHHEIIEPLADKFAAAVRDAIKQRFAEAHRKRQVAETSVEQGRAYVETYVDFTHFVESVDHLVANGASHKHRETEETP